MYKKSKPAILSHLAIRRAIGGLGLILPVGLLIYGYSADAMQPSISHFYYTKAGDIFVGTLIAIGIFLLTYKGYPEGPDWLPILPGDRITSIFAGLGAIGVAIMPTAVQFGEPICHDFSIVVNCQSEDMMFPDYVTGFIGDLSFWHKVAAIVFFIPLAYFCLILFPLGPRKSAERRLERTTYYACGIVILICLTILGNLLGSENQPNNNIVFWAEAIAIWAFSISWLVNGEVLRKIPGFYINR